MYIFSININSYKILIITFCLLILFYLYFCSSFYSYNYELFNNLNNNSLIIHYKCKTININNINLGNIASKNIIFDTVISDVIMIDKYEKHKNDFSLGLVSIDTFITLPPLLFSDKGLSICFNLLIKSSNRKMNYANVFDFGNEPNNDNITLKIYENNIDNHLSIYNNRRLYKATFRLDDFEINKWFHFSIVINQNYWLLYFNGVSIPFNIAEFIYPEIHPRLFNFIGKNNSEDYSFGTYIDDFRIYNSSLSNDEINQIILEK